MHKGLIPWALFLGEILRAQLRLPKIWMVVHEWFHWICLLFSLSQWVELTSTHWRSKFFSLKAYFVSTAHMLMMLDPFCWKCLPVDSGLNLYTLTPSETGPISCLISIQGLYGVYSSRYIKENKLNYAINIQNVSLCWREVRYIEKTKSSDKLVKTITTYLHL
jgi:hypothetical protein